jgi:hypothetical protein
MLLFVPNSISEIYVIKEHTAATVMSKISSKVPTVISVTHNAENIAQ